MKRIFLVCVLVAGLGVGCGEDLLGTEVITTTWDVSNYTVEGTDACEAVTEDPPFFVLNAFDITIDGSDAALDSLDFVLGGVTITYDPTDDTVEFTDTFTDGPDTVPDCVVELMDTFTVELDDPNVSLDQNTTVQVIWDHREMEDVTAVPGTCTPEVWGVVLPCDSQATFTLTQQTQ